MPIASLYAAYGTSSDPVGAELDGTSANYGGLNPTVADHPDLRSGRSKASEVGTKWELFDRHLLATAALFRTDVSNARELIPTGYPNAGTIQAGAAYHVQGIDLGAEGKITDKVERLYRPRADEHQGGPFGRSEQCRSAARLHRQPIVQRADQIQDH